MSVAALLQEALDVDLEVVQYCAASLDELDSKSTDDVLHVIGPFAEGLGLTSQRVTVLCEQLAAALLGAEGGTEPVELGTSVESEPIPQPNVKSSTCVAADALEIEAMSPDATSGPAEQQQLEQLERQHPAGGGFQLPKKTARRRRTAPTQCSGVTEEKPPDTVGASPLPGQASPCSNNQERKLAAAASTTDLVGQARSIAPDIASALSAYSSRKQLRRFAAELGLQADDPTGMVALVALDAATVEAALAATVADGASRNALSAFLKQLAADGLPDYVIEQPDALVGRPTAADDACSSATKRAPPHCCVECHSRCAPHNSAHAHAHAHVRTPLHPPTHPRSPMQSHRSAATAGNAAASLLGIVPERAETTCALPGLAGPRMYLSSLVGAVCASAASGHIQRGTELWN